MNKNLVSQNKASELLGVSKSHMTNLVKQGKVSVAKSEKHGKTVRKFFDLSELRRFKPEAFTENVQETPKVDTSEHPDVRLKEQEIRHLKALLDEKDERIADLNRAMALLTDQREKNEEKPKGFLSRLFGS